MAEREVEVVVQIGGSDVTAGRMWAHRRGKTESATFGYSPEYLARDDAYPLDPTGGWREAARQAGLSGDSISQMEPAFQHASAGLAREIRVALA